MARLRAFGYTVAEPASGLLACGEDGPGRLPEWEEAREYLLKSFCVRDLAGRTVLVTAGPTREHIDPTRYLSNPSTGKMGYALARAAKRRGAEVILISGPTALPPPPGVELIPVTTAAEMYTAVLDNYARAAVVIKAAAVSDFRPETTARHKIKKGKAELTVNLVRNTDILQEMGKRKKKGDSPILVGFAAESRNHLAEGRRKLKEKNLDFIVINDIADKGSGFAVETNRVTLIDRKGGEEKLPLLSKDEVATHIWDRVVQLKIGE
jgi:phosphopantothenoylcysteine decarboxylase/phosphopantothenate--cysteine ligase